MMWLQQEQTARPPFLHRPGSGEPVSHTTGPKRDHTIQQAVLINVDPSGLTGSARKSTSRQSTMHRPADKCPLAGADPPCFPLPRGNQIGRASCRERVEISV